MHRDRWQTHASGVLVDGKRSHRRSVRASIAEDGEKYSQVGEHRQAIPERGFHLSGDEQ